MLWSIIAHAFPLTLTGIGILSLLRSSSWKGHDEYVAGNYTIIGGILIMIGLFAYHAMLYSAQRGVLLGQATMNQGQ